MKRCRYRIGRIIFCILLLVVIVVGVILFINRDKTSKEDLNIKNIIDSMQKEEAKLDKVRIYGTHLNFSGELNKRIYLDNVDDAKIIFKNINDGKDIKVDIEYDVNREGHLTFYTSDKINEGIDLEGLSIGNYIITLKLSEKNYNTNKNDINYYFEDQYRIYSLNIHNDLHLAFNNAWQIDDIYVEEDYHDKNIQIIMLACKDEAGCKLVKDKFGGRFDVRHHHGFTSLDINLIGNNKADGIKHIMEYLKVDVSHTYAFGDGLNDIEMLTMVGHGIAMGNAFDEVKAVAKELTDDVLNDGFYKGLLRHGLIDAKL